MGPIITVEGPGRTLSQGPVAGEINPHSGAPKVDMHGLLAVDLGDKIAVGKPIWKERKNG
jgi:hypothetical protein